MPIVTRLGTLSAMPRLAYCTNVAPADDLDSLCDALGGLWNHVRLRVAAESGERDARLGLGLWLPAPVAHVLARDEDARTRLTAALDDSGLELVTLNAFPADAFHAPVVKTAVYRPDWFDEARATYTLDVARAAALLSPPGSDVTLSTLPVRFEACDGDELALARRRLVEAAHALALISWETGVTVRLAVEPEPCCAVETTDQALRLLAALDDTSREHLGVCLDLCHACVEHEDPLESLARYEAAGVRVFKIQVSAALEVPDPADPAQRSRLAAFVEPRWLHQVGRRAGDVVKDLPDALALPSQAGDGPWRVHFHVPLHEAEVGGLPTTRDTVARVLEHVATLSEPPVLELETYTWSVVPGAADDLALNVANEILWAKRRLAGAVPA